MAEAQALGARDEAPPPGGSQGGVPSYSWPDFWMLVVIVAALVIISLGGIEILVLAKGFMAADIVAVLSPALAAVGTVSAGVFGYTLGSRGTATAQQTAVSATQQAAVAQQEKAAIAQAAAPLSSTVGRIINQATLGGEAPGMANHYAISKDDIQTLAAVTAAVTSLPQLH